MLQLCDMVTESDEPNAETSLGNQEIEQLVLSAKETVEEMLELAEVGFIDHGERFSFEQMAGRDDWSEFTEQQKAEFVKGMGEILGVELVSPRVDQEIRREFQEGTPGTRSEQGADVVVMRTQFEVFELHVKHYRNPDIGTQYDLVKV